MVHTRRGPGWGRRARVTRLKSAREREGGGKVGGDSEAEKGGGIFDKTRGGGSDTVTGAGRKRNASKEDGANRLEWENDAPKGWSSADAKTVCGLSPRFARFAPCDTAYPAEEAARHLASWGAPERKRYGI